MPTRLLLLSHGRTAGEAAVGFPDDESLSDKGLAAVRRLAERLPRLDRAFASPARAARESAEALRVEAAPEPALGDQDWGRWRGRSLDEIAASEPDALKGWIAGDDPAPPGGEPLAAVIRRIGIWLDGRREAGGRVLAVTHAAVLRAAVLHVLGAHPSAARALDVEPLTLAEFTCDGRRWALGRLGPWQGGN
ncbi:histidine phosphatase family protein [Aureimonas leprariae]|uniref:Histidine phosphatase family protein n=1 Tax=Plantimonas leprariae TaxID=2615207 RepID=A0A7V7PMF8_9HYPH|nr:histidine phosphatase family protein [Aureimonas leprariae]KAB0678113.1 histidine phosphatase family protein [Aureimonas leprariae]